MIDFDTFPEPRQLKAQWTYESADDLRVAYAASHDQFQWAWLWNWKMAYNDWKWHRLEKKMVKEMNKEIRKELDEAFEVIKNEYN